MSTYSLHIAPVAIVGCVGMTGGRVNQRLTQRGIATRCLSRSTIPPFNWNRPQAWAAALDGVRSAYITYEPDPVTAESAEAIAELGGVARQRGLERVVMLSSRGEPSALRAEAALQASGITWTSVRTSWFDQYFSEGYLLDSVLAGEVALPAGTVREAFIDADDVADVVVAALVDERHANRAYDVTGPRALTFAEAAGEIGKGLSRPMRYVEITPEDFKISLRAYVSEDVVRLLHRFFTVGLGGHNKHVTRDVEGVLGRPPHDFSSYVRNTVAAGTWSI